MKRLLSFMILGVGTITAMAQEPISNIQPVKLGENVNVKLGGFARADYFLDTRIGKEGVDGLLYLWPEDKKTDSNDKDLNEKINQNLSATATRFSALFSGPEALKAKASAYFEFDFTGGSSGYVNFRQGWVKLEWPKSSLMIGRNWHPLLGLVPPSNISLNYGTPFGIFCRGEQVRFTYKIGPVSLLGATFWQAAHASFGPNLANGEPEQSLRFLRNSMLPDLNFQVHYTGGKIIAGVMGEFKSLQPRTYTSVVSGNYKTNEKVNSLSLGAFGQFKTGKFVAKANAILGQNLAEMFMQGGYARISLDPITGHETYSPTTAFTSWLNLTYGDKVRWGIFGALQKNYGLKDAIVSGYKFYGRSDNIAGMWRVAPSVSVTSGRMVFQGEWEITTASYGQYDLTDKAKVKDTKDYTNNRLALSVSYFF